MENMKRFTLHTIIHHHEHCSMENVPFDKEDYFHVFPYVIETLVEVWEKPTCMLHIFGKKLSKSKPLYFSITVKIAYTVYILFNCILGVEKHIEIKIQIFPLL